MNAKPLPPDFYLPGELQYTGTAADMVVILHKIAHERLYEYAGTVKMLPALWDALWRTLVSQPEEVDKWRERPDLRYEKCNTRHVHQNIIWETRSDLD